MQNIIFKQHNFHNLAQLIKFHQVLTMKFYDITP